MVLNMKLAQALIGSKSLIFFFLFFTLLAENHIRSNLFTINEAFVLDSDGEGFCDSIYFDLMLSPNAEALTITDIDSINLDFSEYSKFTAKSYDINPISETSFFVLYDTYDESGGASFVIYTKEGEVHGNALDRVSPVLEMAQVTTGDDVDRDSLLIVLTESIGDDIPRNVRINVQSDDGLKELISDDNYKENDNTLRLVFPKWSFADGDSIKLPHNSGITDTSGNATTNLAKAVPLQFHIVTSINDKSISKHSQAISLNGLRLTTNNSLPYDIAIYSSNGSVVAESKGINKTINLKDYLLASGVYQLRLVQGEEIFTLQLAIR